MLRACIFAHYDKDDIVDDYVYYYLNELLSVVQKLVFVTVSDISTKDVKRLNALNIEVIKRENVGYDFYSYKVGIERLDLNLYDELMICNDSTFGPIIPIKNIFEKMYSEECDFWGITDSEQRAYHLQSYFLVFRKAILKSLIFANFWDELKILEDKQEIIKRYEIGISQTLLKNNYSSQVYVKYPTNEYNNITRLLNRLLRNPYKIFKLLLSPHKYYSEAIKKTGNVSTMRWHDLLLQDQLPFLKKSLITNKYERVKNMKKLRMIFKNHLPKINYPIALIENYFRRNV